MSVLSCSLLGYFLGTFNPAYMFGKLKGFDIRDRGSGNAGASNAVITMGKSVGLISALFDIFKAYLAVNLAGTFFGQLHFSKELAGVMCIVGHIFPVWMHFHGGKGLACLGGMVLAFNWKLFFFLLIAELILALAIDYICIVPITASFTFTLLHARCSDNLIGTLLLFGVSVLIFYKHIENFRRIQNGTEAHFSFLWKKEEEIERLKMNHDRQA